MCGVDFDKMFSRTNQIHIHHMFEQGIEEPCSDTPAPPCVLAPPNLGLKIQCTPHTHSTFQFVCRRQSHCLNLYLRYSPVATVRSRTARVHNQIAQIVERFTSNDLKLRGFLITLHLDRAPFSFVAKLVSSVRKVEFFRLKEKEPSLENWSVSFGKPPRSVDFSNTTSKDTTLTGCVKYSDNLRQRNAFPQFQSNCTNRLISSHKPRLTQTRIMDGNQW